MREDEEALLAPSPSEITTPDLERTFPSRNMTYSLIITGFLPQLAHFMVPSFLRRSQPLHSTVDSEKHTVLNTPKRLPTEYLDGVRGIASFIVFIFHWSHMFYNGTNSGYDASRSSSVWQLPIIRIFYSGSAMVAIFFVLSGYVLSLRFVQKMSRHDLVSIYPSLTSLTFRRAIRLFLPSLASCLLAFLGASIGVVRIPSGVNKKPFHHGFSALLSYLDRESNPWTWQSYMSGFYNPQLWTIALEFRGSMIIFLTLLALARSRTSVRALVESGVVIHASAHKRWDVALFVSGLLIAELDVFIHASTSRKALSKTPLAKLLLCISLFLGLWLSGFPRDNAKESWGYMFLNPIWPLSAYRRRFWHGVSAILLVGPMPFLPALQRPFSFSPVRYLGKISFSLYLVHGLGNRTVGRWIKNATQHALGEQGYWTYLIGFVIATLLYTPLVLWLSDLFWRAVDLPSTRLAKWMEEKCTAEREE